MIQHILLPDIDIAALQLLPEHKEWLASWLREVHEELECGSISSAWCLQGLLAERILYGEVQTDWKGAISGYLRTDDGQPLAYSEAYGKKLYKFSQWKQAPVHAVHTHWWIGRFFGATAADCAEYARLIESFIQSSGWIYNARVSPTNVRTRMKSELLMSLAIGLEILSACGVMEERKPLFESLLSSTPVTGYLSAEYFRLYALRILDSAHLAPSDFASVLTVCEAGDGYCDFSVESKVDDYMGTQKRSARDKAIHSALSSLHAAHIAQHCHEEIKEIVSARLRVFGDHLRAEPLDIPAFRMRDIDVPFGTDLSPLEIMAASHIISHYNG